jgi:hypothetical protein
VLGGPAFINDQAEEQHHYDVLRDPAADALTKATARLELARLYERHGHFAEAAEMYERNVWDGIRTPATYAGLAAAYRELGRADLADAALEQVRRHGGAAGPARPSQATSTATAVLPRTQRSRAAAETIRPVETPRSRTPRTSATPSAAPATRTSTTAPATRAAIRREAASQAAGAGTAAAGAAGTASAALRQLQDTVAPFLAGQAGKRTLIVSTVLLPICVGLGIFAAVVLSSARSRPSEQAAGPTPAPVATVAPSPAAVVAPTSFVPAALADPPASARLVVNNVGPDGVSLRRSPGTTGQRIKVWTDGTEMADLGETQNVSGQTWRKVRDPDGNVGWSASEFLADPATRARGATGAAPAPAAAMFASGGLGLSRTEWERSHGQPSRSSIFLEYDGGRLVVGLLETNVWHIERVWMRNEAVALDAAREDARAYLPSDAVLGQSIDRGDGRVIDVYSSALLASRFGPTAWNGGKPGSFSIQYKFRAPSDRMVVSAMFRLGDGPF